MSDRPLPGAVSWCGFDPQLRDAPARSGRSRKARQRACPQHAARPFSHPASFLRCGLRTGLVRAEQGDSRAERKDRNRDPRLGDPRATLPGHVPADPAHLRLGESGRRTTRLSSPYHHRFEDRWIATWLFPRHLVAGGYLDQALCDPVILAVEGHVQRGNLVAAMYAIWFLRDVPEWIDLGPVARLARAWRHPGDPRGEIAELLLSRLQGTPEEQIEKLLEGISDAV